MWRPLQVMQGSFFLIQSIVQVLIAFVAVATLNWAFIFIVFFLLLPAFIIQTRYAKNTWTIWESKSPLGKKFFYISDLIQSGNSIKEIKLFETGPFFLKELRNLHKGFTHDNSVAGKSS